MQMENKFYAAIYLYKQALLGFIRLNFLFREIYLSATCPNWRRRSILYLFF